MSEAYAGKSDQQIINEAASDLDFRSDYQQSDKFNPRTTVLSEQSGVNESGLERFPGASVSVGRTGATGGGTNPQNIPPEEGGDSRSQRVGESSERFEGLGGPDDKRHEMLKNNPATFQNHPNWQQETVPRTENQALEADQEGTARSYAFNS